MDYFFETARQLSGKKIYVSMPLHSSLSKNNTSVINEFNSKFESEGFVVRDFSRKIPDKQFFTQTHLDESGHAAMAQLLSDIIVP